MQVESLHPDVTYEQVQETTGFELVRGGELAATEPPSGEELRILREEVDPLGLVIGRA